ncbi:MAG: glycosyltransferase family 4 protein [Deltaproteobacteria bacterium]|nr:glycosyltransferase family 4 protein [Deltaproteobacteria bacterium]MBW2046349.1 glycosyltransferase family 4 protein [Deltaproteobacteria bacterium]MBW2301675.1 glycosyltransferase family 4 protein [Deltaproteobacteria bacterium]
MVKGLQQRGIKAGITWLPHRAEYAPWTVPVPRVPRWANITHVNSWMHLRFVPRHLPVVATMHLCVHDPAFEPFKTPLQRLYHRLWIRRVEARMLQRADVVTAVSRYSAERTREVFGCQNIQVIHNGLDTTTFHPLPRSHPNSPFRLLYVGNWSERKGVGLLGPLLQRLGPDFELHYTADRNGHHRQYGLPSNCRCLGRLGATELVRAYQTADALLFPSRLEGFGLVAAEAMACGLPVIAAAASSLPEVVEGKVTGLLCPMDDVAAFAKVASSLANNPPLWQAMRQAARKRAVILFDEGRQMEHYVNLYRAILRKETPNQ